MSWLQSLSTLILEHKKIKSCLPLFGYLFIASQTSYFPAKSLTSSFYVPGGSASCLNFLVVNSNIIRFVTISTKSAITKHKLFEQSVFRLQKMSSLVKLDFSKQIFHLIYRLCPQMILALA